MPYQGRPVPPMLDTDRCRPRVRLVIPLWGGDYVRRFARFSLPSLLAPGNLPALAAACDLDLALLMPERDRRELAAAPAFAQLVKTVRLRDLPIDDLMVSRRGEAPFYGLTLTRAYWRGVADVGDAMTETRFVFMNADFVVADGSLRSLATRIAAGHRVVLASNLRCVAEDMERPLSAHLAPDGTVLSLAPRPMVALALRHQHPLQLAKIVDANLCHTIHPNQFFWQTDDETMVSHHYLYFPLCIHPERALPTVEGFCDYAFVPELCPTAESVAMEDSDEFCMFELQSRRTELELLRIGTATPTEVAASLSSWTTRGQREAALRHQVVFHVGPLGEAAQRLGEVARAHMLALDRRLTPTPLHHLDHPYWVTATAACRPRRNESTPASGSAAAPGLGTKLRRLLWGTAPALRPWHPHWLDFRPLAQLVAETGGTDGRHALYIHDGSEGSGRLAEGLTLAVSCSLTDAVAGSLEQRLAPQGDRRLIIVEIARRHYEAVHGLAELLTPYLAQEGRLAFHLFEPTPWLSGVALAYDVRRLLGYLGAFTPGRCALVFAGGEEKRRNAQLFHWLSGILRRFGPLSFPVLAPLWLWAVFWTARANRALAPSQDARRPLRDLSSVTLVFRRPLVEHGTQFDGVGAR